MVTRRVKVAARSVTVRAGTRVYATVWIGANGQRALGGATATPVEFYTRTHDAGAGSTITVRRAGLLVRAART